jgi:hypothetical protein
MNLNAVREYVHIAGLWLLLGIIAGGYQGIQIGRSVGPIPSPSPAPAPLPTPGPLPPPAPIPVPVPVPVTTDDIWVSLILPSDQTQGQAELRSELAQTDWKPLKASFRAYNEGQPELDTLRLTGHAQTAGMPVVLIQAGPQGKPAPIVKVMKPSTADEVLVVVKAMRGR